MRPDTTLRPEKPPRALIISTGEDVPRGQSLRARMMVLELSPGDLDWERLTGCQSAAGSGLYALAMSGYIRWLAARYEGIRESLKEEHAELRKAAGASGQHRRTPGIVADLALGLRYFLLFAHESGAIDSEKARELWARGWRALGEPPPGSPSIRRPASPLAVSGNSSPPPSPAAGLTLRTPKAASRRSRRRGAGVRRPSGVGTSSAKSGVRRASG